MKLLETSYLVDYLRGREVARNYFDQHRHEPMAASTVSMFELAYGAIHTEQGDLDTLLDALHWVDFLSFEIGDAIEAATVDAETTSKGEPIPISDVLIAGTARRRGATLVVADGHFERVDRLSIDRYRPE